MSAEWAEEQLKKLNVSFEEADADHSGSLSMDEVVNILQNHGFKGGKEDAKALFRQLDVNQDQKLTREEFSAALNKLPRITVKEFVLRKAFNALDKDGSGTLTRAEIEKGSNDCGIAIAPDKLEQLLTVLEKDSKDDVVDYDEFLHALGMEETGRVMYQVFSHLDSDHSGYLTKDEIMRAVQEECELKLRAAKIADLLVAWHKDSDQKLDYKEFVQVWIKYK